MTLSLLLGLSACGSKEDGSIKAIGESCNKLSKSAQYESKDNSILYMSEGESGKKGEGMPGLQRLSNKSGFSAEEIQDKVGDSGSANLEKNGYIIGISPTAQNLMLVIKKKS